MFSDKETESSVVINQFIFDVHDDDNVENSSVSNETGILTIFIYLFYFTPSI